MIEELIQKAWDVITSQEYNRSDTFAQSRMVGQLLQEVIKEVQKDMAQEIFTTATIETPQYLLELAEKWR